MARIAVCDKSEQVRVQVMEQIRQIPKVEPCDAYPSLESLLRSLQRGDEAYQVILMDLEWDETEQALELIQEISELAPGTKIVCMAEHPVRYIQRIFLLADNLSGFLIKPLDETVLKSYILKLTAEEQRDMLLVKSRGVMRPIPLRDILYMESAGHQIEIRTRTERYSCYGQLQKLLEKLSADFLQCHKSYIVNMREIRHIEGNRIVMSDGLMVPISKSRYGETRERYSHYLK
ncbi:MAG: LytTR family DNA-binding domain-containing protein [Eubacteriales bacterium]|nr:LytTR family DNA-binding domain-containing protein [Eubacteriales bacterium]